MKKVTIAVAPVGTNLPEGTTNPLAPEEIAREATACAAAGASVVHLHVRDEKGNQTEDLTVFSKTTALIRQNSDIIIQGSTGGLTDLSLEQRCVSLYDKNVEMASLNLGSVNFGDSVYINTMPEIRYWAGKMKERGIVPEMEIFEGGMIHNSFKIIGEGLIPQPHVYGFALGFEGALPANDHNLTFLRGMLPKDAAWGLCHNNMPDLSLLATAITMGASAVRVGFEDSVYYKPGVAAESNAQLVSRLASLIREMGVEIATPTEAREALGIKQ